MKYEVSFSCLSHVGLRRLMNQDNYICRGMFMDEEQQQKPIWIKGELDPDRPDALLFGVFDGMGGEECGEVASLLAAEVASTTKIGSNPVEDLLEFIRRANLEICRYAGEHEICSMGTTAALLAFVREGIYLCNIGDSKIFRFSDHELKQISVDHVAVAAYGRKPPLSQNLGIPPEEMTLDPYVARGAYKDGDIYLCCSDGLTDMVDAEEIRHVLDTEDFEDMAEILLRMALEAGGRDNITIILCRIEKTGIDLLNWLRK